MIIKHRVNTPTPQYKAIPLHFFAKALLIFTSSALLVACSPSESDLAQAGINNENAQAVTTAWEPSPENLFVFVKTQTPIAELQAYAKEMALKRSEMRLAKDEPAARKQYLEALAHLENKDYAEAFIFLSGLSPISSQRSFLAKNSLNRPPAHSIAEKTVLHSAA